MRLHHGRRTVAVSGLCLATVLLSGCVVSNGESETAVTPTPSPTTVPSPGPTTAFQRGGESWNEFSAGWLEPLVPALTSGMALATVLVVGARFLVPVKRWTRTTTASRSRLIRWGGWAIPAVFLLSLLTTGTVALGRNELMRQILGWTAVSMTLAAAIWCWWWLGARPRVAIRVVDPAGNASVRKSAILTFLIDELGAAPPRGLTHPTATDLTQLADATSKVKENAFLASVMAVLSYVANTAPWQVEVQELGEHRALVDVRWNGALMESELIDRFSEKLPSIEDAPEALEQMTAAVVATSMAKQYVDWTGLYGATAWRSVGLHDVARRMAPEEVKSRQVLLRRAIAHDEKNCLADYALNNELLSKATDPSDLDRYLTYLRGTANFLAQNAKRKPPFRETEKPEEPVEPQHRTVSWKKAKEYPAPTALLMRAILVWAIIQRNQLALQSAKGLAPALDAHHKQGGVTALKDLVTLLQEKADDAEKQRTATWLIRMRTRTAISIHILNQARAFDNELKVLTSGNPLASRNRSSKKARRYESAQAAADDVAQWFAAAGASKDPVIARDYACYLALKAEIPEGEVIPLDKTLQEKLELALADPSQADWARHDPELRTVQDVYWEFLNPDRPMSIWDVQPLKSHKHALAQVGVRTSGALAMAGVGIGTYLGLTFAEFRRLQGVAALARHLELRTHPPYNDGKASRVPLFLAKLVEHDIDSVRLLHETSRDDLLPILGEALRGIRAEGTNRYIPPIRAVQDLYEDWR
jgi:hypothetical protein